MQEWADRTVGDSYVKADPQEWKRLKEEQEDNQVTTTGKRKQQLTCSKPPEFPTSRR